MKALLTFFLFMALPLYSQNKIADELIEMELRRSKVIAAHDSVTLDQMYADDFTGVTAIGFVVTKKDLMNLFRRDNPDVVFTNDRHTATVICSEAATLSGRLTARDKNGKVISQSLYIHVLVKRNGRWQILKGQGTAIPAENIKPN
ncbi:nuclear transport factor 2 family protein [bacterium]|nr:nuclear transport factor 2 family protein [bacterium]